MNMIPQFLKQAADATNLALPSRNDTRSSLDLDPDFEEACARSLQEPMQTPVERLREAMENIITVLADEAKADKAAGDDLFRQASAKHQASCDKLAQIEQTKRALAELAASPSPKPDKPKKSCRRTSVSETAGRAGEAKAG